MIDFRCIMQNAEAAIADEFATVVERRRCIKHDPQPSILAASAPDEGKIGERLALLDQAHQLVRALDLGAPKETLERFARLGSGGTERRDQRWIRRAEVSMRIQRP